MTLAEKVYEAIFNNKETLTWKEKTFNRRFFKGSLRGFDIAGNRFIEQNPNTGSSYAKLVREQGSQIMWIIRLKNNKWLGRIQDGKIIKN